jgi:hypothetical protein
MALLQILMVELGEWTAGACLFGELAVEKGFFLLVDG